MRRVPVTGMLKRLAPLGWMALGALGGALTLLGWIAYRFWESWNRVVFR